MIETFDKQRLTFLTLLLDMCLLSVLATFTLNVFDSFFVYFVFLCHICFYWALFYDMTSWLEYLHYSIFLSLSVSLFLQNKWLQSICLFLLTTIQVLWIQEERCILNDPDNSEKFGYGKEIWYVTFLYSIILSAKLGYIWKD